MDILCVLCLLWVKNYAFLKLLVLLFLFTGCSCSGPHSPDARWHRHKWYPLNFGPQASYVNGYTEDVFVEMASYGGMQFDVTYTNWDNLLDGLKEDKYDAVLTSITPYEFNKAKYDFSSNFLDLGPVLIVPTQSKHTGLNEMDGALVGLIMNDPAIALVAQYPGVIIRTYSSIPALLSGLAAGEISGAVLPRIPAVNYVGDLYASSLKIVSHPMTDAGLKLVVLKGKMGPFNRHLEALKGNKTLEKLMKKWELY